MKKIRIILEDNRNIDLELYEDIAPITVKNFLDLIEKKYYNGVIFHRVIENFMIQTGGYFLDGFHLVDKEKNGNITGEFTENGHKNDLKHTPGVISMARANDPNSASSQFFICSANAPHLNGKYAAFGKTIDQASLDVVMDISKVKTRNIGYGFSDFPVEPITIKTIEVIE